MVGVVCFIQMEKLIILLIISLKLLIGWAVVILFAGALIYSLASGYDPKKTIEFATAASCLKHTIEYDYNLSTIEDVNLLIQNGNKGFVQR